jgi:hypothetical protein
LDKKRLICMENGTFGWREILRGRRCGLAETKESQTDGLTVRVTAVF